MKQKNIRSNEPNLEAWGENVREALKGVIQRLKDCNTIN